jgi:hypothetical protein
LKFEETLAMKKKELEEEKKMLEELRTLSTTADLSDIEKLDATIEIYEKKREKVR